MDKLSQVKGVLKGIKSIALQGIYADTFKGMEAQCVSSYRKCVSTLKTIPEFEEIELLAPELTDNATMQEIGFAVETVLSLISEGADNAQGQFGFDWMARNMKRKWWGNPPGPKPPFGPPGPPPPRDGAPQPRAYQDRPMGRNMRRHLKHQIRHAIRRGYGPEHNRRLLELQDEMQEKIEEEQERFEENVESIEEKMEELQEKIEEMRERLEERLEEIREKYEEKIEEIQDAIEEAAENEEEDCEDEDEDDENEDDEDEDNKPR